MVRPLPGYWGSELRGLMAEEGSDPCCLIQLVPQSDCEGGSDRGHQREEAGREREERGERGEEADKGLKGTSPSKT